MCAWEADVAKVIAQTTELWLLSVALVGLKTRQLYSNSYGVQSKQLITEYYQFSLELAKTKSFRFFFTTELPQHYF